MPTRDAAPAGAPCWIDLMTTDTDRCAAFYSGLFGWSAEPPASEYGGYFSFTKDGAQVAGCMSQGDQPPVWSVYLATNDAHSAVQAAVTSGGQVYVDPMAVGDLGTMAVIADPTGAAVGIWQPGSHQGFGVIEEPGAPGWFELQTRDYEGALSFYRDTFGWDTHVVSDTPAFRYTAVVQGDKWLAGVMDAAALPAEAGGGDAGGGLGAHWSVYFGVQDTDVALQRIVELGGAVLEPAQDSPYGRLATAADPTGARFKISDG